MNPSLLGTCVLFALLLHITAVPWVAAIGLIPRGKARTGGFWISGLIASGVMGVILGLYLDNNNDPKTLGNWGRFLFSLLHLQLGLDLFVVAFLVMLRFWPKGGAVALAAFQEGVRQPKYWLLLAFGVFIMGGSTIIPFFTFGEDIKVVKDLCFVYTMLLPAIFGILAASISVSEEIEGRTAVTLMSKPIMRRDFLLGKFAGIALAALSMTIVLGWWLIWVVLYKEYLDPPITGQETPDPAWVSQAREAFGVGSVADLVRGMCLWIHDALDALPGIVIGFGQVMILTALAVALATRVPMVVNVVACLVFFFLGHLTYIITEVTSRGFPLVSFLAQAFDTVIASLDFMDVGPAINRDVPVPPMDFAIYSSHVFLYALTFTAIALLLGLILFEDRDLA